MRTRIAPALLLAPAMLLTSATALAHHSFPAEFDIDRPVHLTGRVTKVELINPHSWIHIAVADQGGDETIWMIEGGAPNLLFRRGITAQSIPIGSEITIEGWGARDGANRAVGETITFSDGSPLFFRGTLPPAPAD